MSCPGAILFGGEYKMKKFGLLSSSAMGSAALFGLSLIATPAYAQAQDANGNPVCTPEQAAAGTCTLPPAAQADQGTGQNVEVTGTRIRRPNLESNIPITSVAGEEFFQQGQ